LMCNESVSASALRSRVPVGLAGLVDGTHSSCPCRKE
jgi:hypothetical protein